MVRAAAVILTLALAGCDSSPRAWSKAEIQEIARSQQVPLVDQSAGKIAALEARIATLEAERSKNIEMLAGMARSAKTSGDYYDESIARLFANDETFRDNINWLRARQGLPPIPKSDSR